MKESFCVVPANNTSGPYMVEKTSECNKRASDACIAFTGREHDCTEVAKRLNAGKCPRCGVALTLHERLWKDCD